MTVAALDVFIFNASIDAMKPSMGEADLVGYADVLMSHRPLRWLALGGGWLVPLLGFGLGQGLVALKSMRRRAAQA